MVEDTETLSLHVSVTLPLRDVDKVTDKESDFESELLLLSETVSVFDFDDDHVAEREPVREELPSVVGDNEGEYVSETVTETVADVEHDRDADGDLDLVMVMSRVPVGGLVVVRVIDHENES